MPTVHVAPALSLSVILECCAQTAALLVGSIAVPASPWSACLAGKLAVIDACCRGVRQQATLHCSNVLACSPETAAGGCPHYVQPAARRAILGGAVHRALQPRTPWHAGQRDAPAAAGLDFSFPAVSAAESQRVKLTIRPPGASQAAAPGALTGHVHQASADLCHLLPCRLSRPLVSATQAPALCLCRA